MGLSLGDLNPVKHISSAFDSITGMGDARAGMRKANKAQQEAILKAMGQINTGSDLASGYLGTGYGNSQNFYNQGLQQQSGALNQGYNQGIDFLGQGRDQAINYLDPMAQMFDPSMANQFSVQGMGQNLAQFSDPNGAFAPMFASRQNSAMGALGAAGYNRSGNAAATAANIDMETAMGLNQQLFQQQMQNPAFNAMNQQSQYANQFGGNAANMADAYGLNQANMYGNYAGNMAGLEGAYGSDMANLELGRAGNLANLTTGAGASEAQMLQGIGGLKAATMGPLLQAGISAGVGALTGGVGGAAMGGLGSMFSGGPSMGSVTNLGRGYGAMNNQQIEQSLFG